MSHEEGTERFGIQLGGLPGPIGRIIAARIRRQRPQRTFIASSRTKSTADDLTPADQPFRPGRDVFVVRRPGSRPIIRISKQKRKRKQELPPPGVRTMPIERITELPPVQRGRVFKGGSETFNEAAGGFSFPASGTSGAPPRPPKAIAKVEPTMSLHKSILKGIGSAIKRRVRQTSTEKTPALLAGLFGGAGSLGRVLPGLGRAAVGLPGAAAATGFALGGLFGGNGDGAACQSGWHLAKDGSGRCVRNRRMNFGNARAARRSVRRLKGARKLLRDIEKMMPSKPRARRAPAGHVSHLHHTGGS